MKKTIKRIAIAVAGYAVYVGMTTASRGYITVSTALGDLIFPVAIYLSLAAVESEEKENGVE